MAFQKGNTYAMKGPMRHDTTIELITQLNEMTKGFDGKKRTKLNRLIKNLITKATTADDVLDKDGNIIKEGTGDLAAIQEIILGLVDMKIDVQITFGCEREESCRGHERENITADRHRWSLTKLIGPEPTKLGARQSVQSIVADVLHLPPFPFKGHASPMAGRNDFKAD
jgi:hypothetical protein